jgi:alpha-mannosidase
VHDDRTLVEARLERALCQFVRPARYAARVPLVLTVWHVPGEPVPVDQALQASYEPFTTGTVWGEPWSTSWSGWRGGCPRSGRAVAWRR